MTVASDKSVVKEAEAICGYCRAGNPIIDAESGEGFVHKKGLPCAASEVWEAAPLELVEARRNLNGGTTERVSE